MLFVRYSINGRDYELYWAEYSEYDEGAIKLKTHKIMCEVVANKNEALKYLVSTQEIVENFVKFLICR